jgi:outer membrane lipoprotein SlyB
MLNPKQTVLIVGVAQAADEKFKVGERVRVLTGGGVTRISH